jgi:amidase
MPDLSADASHSGDREAPASAELHRLTLAQARAALDAGAVDARALADAALARIAVTEPTVRAWAHLDAARVRRLAATADALPRTSGPGRLALQLRGIGIGVKDIVDTVDLPAELGSSLHAGRQPLSPAACVSRLEAAGAYVFGKTVTTAFAFLDPGPTRNPWNAGHTPGGSSSGSAAAVAAGHVCAAIGTQTNGSVIRPAAFCGVVGFKPTRGLVDFTGVHVFSGTLDTLGTFTRTVADAGLLASALAPDAGLSQRSSAPHAPPRLGLLAAFPWTGVLPEASDALTEAAVRLRTAGAVITPVGFPDAWGDAHRVHRAIMLYEGARALAAIQAQHRQHLSPQVNAALDEGHAIAEADYRAALTAREQAIAYFSEWLAPYDAVIAPPAPGAAPRGLASTGDPGCCTLWSLTGFPAVNLPIGFDSAGLPLGLQLAARANHDAALLQVAAWCEAQLGYGARIAEPSPVTSAPESVASTRAPSGSSSARS